MYNRMHYIKRTPKIYFWVKYRVGDKYGLLGPYDDEQKANDEAINELRGAAVYEVVPLDTRDTSSASRKLKKVTLNETKNIGLAMQRMHRIPPTNLSQGFQGGISRINQTPPSEESKPIIDIM